MTALQWAIVDALVFLLRRACPSYGECRGCDACELRAKLEREAR